MSTLQERSGKAHPITTRVRKALGVKKVLGLKGRANSASRPMHDNESRCFYDALPHPLMTIAPDGMITDANSAAESFFHVSATVMRRKRLIDLMPFGSQFVAVVEQAMERCAPVNEYRVDIGIQRMGSDRLVDIFAAPLPDQRDGVFVMLQERTIADKMDRQMTHLGAARSVSGLAAMLAHEIKNPLSGIRGAAQLLESAVGDEDRALTRLICDEADRIVKLVDRMEMFSDGRPIEREAVNVHAVLDHVKRVAQAGFARHIRFEQLYDPSLPPVHGNRDQLIQVFLNLVKNAAEAIGPDAIDGQIELCSAFKPGFRLRSGSGGAPVSLPLEFCVRDNGPGIAGNLMAHLFEPFITTKASGSGLGLAMVAKIVGDHGGIIECDSQPRRTSFRVLMPMYVSPKDRRKTNGR